MQFPLLFSVLLIIMFNVNIECKLPPGSRCEKHPSVHR